MQKLLAFSFLLVSYTLSAMDKDSREQRNTNLMANVARIESLMLSDVEQAFLEATALASDKSIQEIQDLQVLDLSEIKDVRRIESENCITYFATLKNCDTICADYFIAGPAQGEYSCCRMTKSLYEISIPDRYYHDLKKIYEASLNK